MRQIVFILPFLILVVMIISPVYATSDVPYSLSPLSPNKCFESSFAGVNGNDGTHPNLGFGGEARANGVYDSDFTGLNLKNISLYLCAGSDSGGSQSDSTLATVGVFTKAVTPVLIQSFGTISYNTIAASAKLICNTGCVSVTTDDTPALFSFSGSHVMASGEIIGI